MAKREMKMMGSPFDPEKGIALILGAIGTALLAASTFNLTGAVVGNQYGKNLAFGLIGCVLFISAIVFALKGPEKKKK